MPVRTFRYISMAILGTATMVAVAQAPAAVGSQGASAVQTITPQRRLETGVPEVIDTNNFSPRIVKQFDPRRPKPENPTKPAFMSVPGPTNNLKPGGLLKEKRKGEVKKWPAIGATGWVPADPTMAVGPTNVVVTVNSDLAFYTRTGTIQLQQSFATFFGLSSNTFLYDPKVYYDKLSSRFFIVVLEEDDATQVSRLRIAVSDDSDPNGTWYKYSVNSKLTVGSDNFWLDYPGFGYNKDAIVVSGNMFNFLSSGTQYAGTQLLVMPKSTMLTGASTTVWSLRDTNAFTYQMAEIGDNTVSNLYGISSFNDTTLKACTLTNPSTAPTLTTHFVTVPTKTDPQYYAQSTSSHYLDPSDGRLLNAAWRNGHIISSSSVKGPSTNNAVRWYDLNFTNTPAAAPTLTQSGDIAPTDANQSYIMPAINQNAYGDISVIYTRSSPSIVADLVYSARMSSDAAGTMGAPILLKSSEGATYGGSGGNRWGDYFMVNVDPVDENTFWGVGMVGDAAGNWKTHVYSWSLMVPLSAVSAPSTINAGSSATGTVTMLQNARPGGSVVTLSSSDSHLTVPASVTVANGASTANYNITTTSVSTATPVTITATSGGVTKTTTVTLAPVTATAVSGTVTLQDFTAAVTGRAVTVQLLTPGTNTVVATYNTTLNSTGGFSFNASQTGTYDIRVKASHWLSKKVTNIALSGSTAALGSFSLVNGDVNGDNVINSADQNALTAAFRATAASANWNANADLNGDGVVSASDQAILGKNWNQTGG